MPKLATVLLVDDDSISNFVAQHLFTRLGVAVQLLVAKNGIEALITLDQVCKSAGDCPALVLLDLNMPLMDGIEFLEAYQRFPFAQRQHVTIMVLTSSIEQDELTRVQQLPVAGILTKPLTKDKVARLVAEHFPGL